MSKAQVQIVASKAPPYSVRAGVATEDEQTATRLWREGGMGSPAGADADSARYRWYYLRNPHGEGQVNLVRHDEDGQPIGFLGIGCREFHFAGEPVRAGTLVDFVVNPKHRSVFPALLLQREGRARALKSMQMLYGLPDTKAVAICKRLESQVRFDLPRYVRVLRSTVYLERLAPRWLVAPLAAFADSLDAISMRLQLLLSKHRGEWVDHFDERFDRLWERFDKRPFCIGGRGAEFLAWRFSRQPAHQYRTFIVRHADSAEILMYFVCQFRNGGAFVKDMLNAGSPADLRAGLLLLSRELRRLRARSVDIQVAADREIKAVLLSAQFLVRSSRPFFAMVNEPHRKTAASVRWYVTQADEDV